MDVGEAIAILNGYCKPYDQGGAGDNDLTYAIRAVLAVLPHTAAATEAAEGDGP